MNWKDESHMVVKKVNKMKRLVYAQQGKSASHIEVFWVPKGLSGIRLVYNIINCVLNKVIWIPWLILLDTNEHRQSVDVRTFLSYVGVGDVFHDFMTHNSMQLHVGVDYKVYLFRTF